MRQPSPTAQRAHLWRQAKKSLHDVLDAVLVDQRPALEAAYLNGYALSLYIRVSDPAAAPGAPEPEQPVPALIVPEH